jgi:tRNA(adenine34) deaminase
MSAVTRKKRKSAQSRKATTHRRSKSKAKSGPRWVATVKTVSTFPPEGLFTKDAATIARSLASKKVSPKGPGSGMRMLNYFINRGGRGLSATRRAELERAKRLLSQRIKQERSRQENGRARTA